MLEKEIFKIINTYVTIDNLEFKSFKLEKHETVVTIIW